MDRQRIIDRLRNLPESAIDRADVDLIIEAYATAKDKEFDKFVSKLERIASGGK